MQNRKPYFTDLNEDCTKSIFTYLDKASLFAAGRTSRELNHYLKEFVADKNNSIHTDYQDYLLRDIIRIQNQLLQLATGSHLCQKKRLKEWTEASGKSWLLKGTLFLAVNTIQFKITTYCLKNTVGYFLPSSQTNKVAFYGSLAWQAKKIIGCDPTKLDYLAKWIGLLSAHCANYFYAVNHYPKLEAKRVAAVNRLNKNVSHLRC